MARDLVSALKFRHLLPVATAMAARVEWLAPATLLSGAIVPVPSSRLRSLGRGFERIGQPPQVLVRDGAPRSVLLVVDVLTTGATLSACARALRSGGSIRVAAITFTRRP